MAALKKRNALVLARDEASSMDWVMPGIAVKQGYVDNVLPLNKIALRLREIVLEN